MGVHRIFIHGCNVGYACNRRNVCIFLHHLLDIQMKAKQPNPTNYAIWAEYYGERIKKMCDEVCKLRKK